MFLYVVIFALLAFLAYKSSRKPDRFPPGPPKLPIVGSLPYLGKTGSFAHIIINVAKEYGPVSGIFLGKKPAVIIADYDILKDLFKRDEVSSRPTMVPNNEARPGWETLTGENKDHPPGVIGTSGQYWREQRRFLLRNLKDFGFGKASMESIIQDEMAKLCSKLAELPENEPVDLNRGMNISILNALWSILVGERLELDDPKLAYIIQVFDELLRENSGPSSPILPLLPHRSMAKWPILSRITGVENAFKTFRAMSDFIEPYIIEHQKTLDPDNIRDFVDLMLLEIQNTTDQDSSFYGKTGYYALLNNLIDLFMAGMETTASSLMWTFLFFLHHPEVQDKVHRELDEVVGHNRFPSLDDRPKLHYINAVLLESFRAATLVPPGVPHYTSTDVAIGDYIIPKGTVVFGSLYHIMNDPQHFKDPHTFNPDRFLNSKGEFVSDERVAPFGVGKRICLGQTLAEKEFYIFFAGLMQQFKVERDDRYPPPSYKFSDMYPKGILRAVPAFKLRLVHRLKF